MMLRAQASVRRDIVASNAALHGWVQSSKGDQSLSRLSSPAGIKPISGCSRRTFYPPTDS